MHVDINFIAFIEMYYYHYYEYPAALENVLRGLEYCAGGYILFFMGYTGYRVAGTDCLACLAFFFSMCAHFVSNVFDPFIPTKCFHSVFLFSSIFCS